VPPFPLWAPTPNLSTYIWSVMGFELRVLYIHCITLLPYSTETLATMIKQLLPDTLEYLHNLNTEHLGALYTSHLQSRVSGITETRCFLNFLSAVLERNSPKVDSSLTYTGTASRSSRVSSQMTESRASSAMLHSYSASSVQVYGTPRAGSYQTSRYVWCHLILTVILPCQAHLSHF